MLKIGHRGAMGYEPENTLASFKKALELKVDIVEFDVYQCETGQLVVIHDDKVDRTTNGQGYVIDMTFKELRSLDTGQGEKVPTLEEVLDLINRKVKVNIELKGTGTAKPVFELIKKYIKEKDWQYDDFLISSFNYDELKAFNSLTTDFKIGALFKNISADYLDIAKSVNADSVNLNLKSMNQKIVDEAHLRDFKVFVYTVNDEADIARMKQLGVDGIFSNFPDRI